MECALRVLCSGRDLILPVDSATILLLGDAQCRAGRKSHVRFENRASLGKVEGLFPAICHEVLSGGERCWLHAVMTGRCAEAGLEGGHIEAHGRRKRRRTQNRDERRLSMTDCHTRMRESVMRGSVMRESVRSVIPVIGQPRSSGGSWRGSF